MSELEFCATGSESFLRFPEDFLWGVSTAAHQVEGNNCNQWSDWEQAGRIKSGDACGKACDWWENPERDFDIARDLGLKALRLSLEWSRIEPEEGCFDLPSLQRYREMLEGLHQRGIEPIVCLHHFTHPRWFEQRGHFFGRTRPNCLTVSRVKWQEPLAIFAGFGSPSMSPTCMRRVVMCWVNSHPAARENYLTPCA